MQRVSDRYSPSPSRRFGARATFPTQSQGIYQILTLLRRVGDSEVGDTPWIHRIFYSKV